MKQVKLILLKLLKKKCDKKKCKTSSELECLAKAELYYIAYCI